MNLEQGLSIYFASRFYPPIPQSMVEPCIKAIYAVADEKPKTFIALPEGITYQNSTSATALTIVEAHRLWDFVEEVCMQ